MARDTDISSRLHVLTLTPFFPSDHNDANGCFVAESLKELKKFGVESSVIAVSPIHHPRKHSNALAPADWVRYFQFPSTFGLATAGKFLYERLARHVRELHRVNPFDLIHAHAALPCGHAAALLSKNLKIPFVVTVHGLDVFNSCTGDGMPAAGRAKVSRKVYGEARVVICISGKVEEILKAGTSAGTRSIVVHNGVDPDLFSPAPTPAQDLVSEILVVGTLLPSKGHELTLQALGKLKSLYPELRCLIIGEGRFRRKFEALANDLGLERQVQFLGRQSRLKVATAMQACSIFVLPSWNEAFGCVYIEAMSCAKPVIGCHGQGIDEVIEHGKNGYLIPAHGLEELVQTLGTLLASPESCARIGAAARETILSKFTLSNQAQCLVKIYNQAIL